MRESILGLSFEALTSNRFKEWDILPSHRKVYQPRRS